MRAGKLRRKADGADGARATSKRGSCFGLSSSARPEIPSGVSGRLFLQIQFAVAVELSQRQACTHLHLTLNVIRLGGDPVLSLL
jgi:hypothetical protein